MTKRCVCISLEGSIAVKLEKMIALPLSHAADPKGLRSRNISRCGSMRAHFTACRVGAWKAQDADDLTDEKIGCM